MKQDEVAPVQVLLKLPDAAIDRPPAVLVLEEDAGKSAGDLLGHLIKRHVAAGAGGEFNLEVIAGIGVSTPPGMRIMLHDPYPTRRNNPQRAAELALYQPFQHGPRPPGDDPPVRGRLVATTHRPPSGLSSSHRPRRPQGLSPARHCGLAASATRSPARPPTPSAHHRPAHRTAGPRADLDQPPTRCRVATGHPAE